MQLILNKYNTDSVKNSFKIDQKILKNSIDIFTGLDQNECKCKFNVEPFQYKYFSLIAKYFKITSYYPCAQSF